MRALSLIETRVLGTLYEKQHTVPDSYPLTLNALVSGANQKTSRSPVMEATESEVQAAVKLPPWKLGEFNAHVRHTPTEQITRGLMRMAEVDLAIKSSIGTPALQLEVLVCELTS